LEFTASGSGAECELLVHLDLDGLAALLRAVEAAMASGRSELIPAAPGGTQKLGDRGSPDVFGKVTVTFDTAGNSGDGMESRAWIVPGSGSASLRLPARQ
ncbi:MAG TPA: hypothetical protein VFR28_02360, partial [Allosphingosinicella sp.]|nr:hypothetical protein [Allosphingosinicella sp.]